MAKVGNVARARTRAWNMQPKRYPVRHASQILPSDTAFDNAIVTLIWLGRKCFLLCKISSK
jgi:hypothetical protein